MALVDIAGRRIRAKIVYYGPTLGGKTTNLAFIHRHANPGQTGEFRSIAAESARTLFFDYMPIEAGSVGGFQVTFQLYTVAGQANYERTRQAVLKGADGIVFVVDAQQERLFENLESLAELEANLLDQQLNPDAFPIVVQYNKLDLPNALPSQDLDRLLNSARRPRIESSALTGHGVFETLQAISKKVARSL
jgi:signal recognition particle receptor subunit beta